MEEVGEEVKEEIKGMGAAMMVEGEIKCEQLLNRRTSCCPWCLYPVPADPTS